MNPTPEQKAAVAAWIATGDNLSAIQKKLAEQFNLSLTYMDVRFLVDDLDLTLKDNTPAPSPAPQADLSAPAQPQEQAPLDEDLDDDPLADQPPMDDADAAYADEGVPPQPPPEGAPAATNVHVEVDNVTLIPGAMASGSVVFTDGVTGKWIVDNYGRPGFTQISQDGYRPTQADAQAFMRELGAALHKKGF